MQRPQKPAFGEMRESGVRGVLVFAQITDAATTSPPAQIPGRMKSGYPIWSGVSSAPLAAGAERTSGRMFTGISRALS